MNRAIAMAFPFILFSASVALCAAELPTEASGSAIREWLELQRSGAVASPIRQTISGPVAEKIYERYLKSFAHPIPEYFPRDSYRY